jgi:hypothetical protein
MGSMQTPCNVRREGAGIVLHDSVEPIDAVERGNAVGQTDALRAKHLRTRRSVAPIDPDVPGQGSDSERDAPAQPAACERRLR